MITNVYLVRHAHSTYTPDELCRPLSEKGLRDAGKVTELLSLKNISHVISSPYRRAVQTVEGIANLNKLTIVTDDGFRERKLAADSVADFQDTVLKAWENLNYALPGGESGFCAQNRGIRSLRNAIDKYRGGNIVIGTHGNLMVLIMNYYDKKYDYAFWDKLNLPDIYRLGFTDEVLFEIERIWRTKNV